MKVTVWDVTNNKCNIRDYMNVNEKTGRIYVQMEHMDTVLIDRTKEWEGMEKELHDTKSELSTLSERNDFLEKANRIDTATTLILKAERNCYREARKAIERKYEEYESRSPRGYEEGFLDGLEKAMHIIDKELEEMK